MRFATKAGAALLVLSLLIQPALAQEIAPEAAPEAPTPSVTAVEEPTATSTPAEPEPAPEALPEPIPEPVPEPELSVPEPLPEPVIATSTATTTETATTTDAEAVEEPIVPELPADAEYVPGEVIVKFKDSKVDLERASGGAKAEAFAEAQSVEVVDELAPANIVVVETQESVAEAVATLNDDPLVEYAEPNYLYSIQGGGTDGSDQYWGELWALRNTGQEVEGIDGEMVHGTPDADINAPEAWELSRGAGVVVAVIDTGVAYAHPDLADNMWNGSTCLVGTTTPTTPVDGCTHGYDLIGDDADPLPSYSDHGTHVAGTIAAVENTIGTVGVAPEAEIMALRTDFKSGNEVFLSTSAIVDAIDFARINGVRIINASFGGYASSTAMYQAMDRFGDADGLIIAAAGNDEENTDSDPFYPAGFDLDNIIVVAATDQDDELTDFSNYGAVSVDVAAPGFAIKSTSLGTSVNDVIYEYKDGTSMAAPHVSGIAALLLSYDPTLTVSELKTAILNTGDTIPGLSGKVATGKRVNAFNALASIATTTVTGTLEVVTQVTTDNGRAAPSSLAFAVDDGRSRAAAVSGTTTVTVAPGTYDITGAAAANYTLSSSCTDLTVVVGSTTTCVLSYDDNPDTVAPVITLIGGSSLSLTVGQTYTELGATAVDDVDGALASTSITINASAVNTGTAGTYTVVYTAADTAGNVGSTTRSVVISNPPSSGGGGGGGGGGGSSKSKKKNTKKDVKKTVKKPTTKKTVKKAPVTPEPLPKPVATPATPLNYSTYRFNFDMGVGATGIDVTELQKVLVAKGYLFVAPTGYYGPMTAAALRQYQLARAIPSTGYLGPLTRAALNAGK